MKPLKLVMSAFGPYAGEEKIDLPTANPNPRCGKGYKVPEIKPTFLGK